MKSKIMKRAHELARMMEGRLRGTVGDRSAPRLEGGEKDGAASEDHFERVVLGKRKTNP